MHRFLHRLEGIIAYVSAAPGAGAVPNLGSVLSLLRFSLLQDQQSKAFEIVHRTRGAARYPAHGDGPRVALKVDHLNLHANVSDSHIEMRPCIPRQLALGFEGLKDGI